MAAGVVEASISCCRPALRRLGAPPDPASGDRREPQLRPGTGLPACPLGWPLPLSADRLDSKRVAPRPRRRRPGRRLLLDLSNAADDGKISWAQVQIEVVVASDVADELEADIRAAETTPSRRDI